MDNTTFEYLLNLVSPYIAKQDTVIKSQNTTDLAYERLLHHNQTSKFFFYFLKFLTEGPTYSLDFLK